MIIPNSPLLWLKWIFIGKCERQEEFLSVSEPRCVSTRDEGAYRSPTFHVSLLLTAVTEQRCRRVARGRGAAAAERGWGVPTEAAGLWVAPAQPVPERGDHHVRGGGSHMTAAVGPGRLRRLRRRREGLSTRRPVRLHESVARKRLADSLCNKSLRYFNSAVFWLLI